MLTLKSGRALTKRQLALFGATFGVFGIVVVLASHAAISLVAIEPESGNLGGCVGSATVSGASGGAVARFNVCATPAPTASPAPTPVAGSCSISQPAGTGITAYQGLSGANFAAQVNSASGANVVSLPAGTFSFDDFTVPAFDSSLFVGATITSPTGIIGSGIGASHIQMTPNTSTKAGAIRTDTNQLSLMAFTKSGLKLSCFSLNGTAQGHLYNGIRLSNVSGATLSDLKLTAAAPGNSNVPPGETFAINDYHGSNNTYRDIEIDGAGTGASAFASNGSMATSNNSWIDDYAHHNPFSAGIALWQLTGTQTLTNFRSTFNKTGINLERINGIVNITRPTLSNNGQDFFIGNDKGSASINIYDPVLDAGKKVRIYFPATEQKNLNLQVKSDIKVFVNGVDVSSTMIQYL